MGTQVVRMQGQLYASSSPKRLMHAELSFGTLFANN